MWRLAATVALAALAVGAACDSAERPLALREEESEALPAPGSRLVSHEVSFVDGSVWVTGGYWAPADNHQDEDAHVAANRAAYQLDVDGTLRRELVLPLGRGEHLVSSWVVAHDGRVYLAGASCRLSFSDDVGWGGTCQRPPLELYDIGGDDLRPIAVDAALWEDVTDHVADFRLLGAAAGRLWLLQRNGTTARYNLEAVRLVSVDLATGAVAAHRLPDGVVRLNSACLAGSILYAMVPTIEEVSASRLTIHTSTVEDTDHWTTFGEVVPSIGGITSGQLECIGEVIFLDLARAGGGGVEWLSLSSRDATVTERLAGVTPEGETTSVAFHAQADGAVLTGHQETEDHTARAAFWRMDAGGRIHLAGTAARLDPWGFPVGVWDGERILDFTAIAQDPAAGLEPRALDPPTPPGASQ
jgi:hypothetical protein